MSFKFEIGQLVLTSNGILESALNPGKVYANVLTIRARIIIEGREDIGYRYWLSGRGQDFFNESELHSLDGYNPNFTLAEAMEFVKPK